MRASEYQANEQLADLVEALRDVARTASGPVNDRNITWETRATECRVIASAALERVKA